MHAKITRAKMTFGFAALALIALAPLPAAAQNQDLQTPGVSPFTRTFENGGDKQYEWQGPLAGSDSPEYYDGRGVAMCEARFRSYDPATGSYRGFDGARHSCP